MEPKYKSKRLADHFPLYSFLFLLTAILFNLILTWILLQRLEFSYLLHIGLIFSFGWLYSWYVCIYAIMIRQNYLGRNKAEWKDIIFSFWVFIRLVVDKWYGWIIVTCLVYLLYCVYITITIFVLLGGTDDKVTLCVCILYVISCLFLEFSACVKKALWQLVLKWSNTGQEVAPAARENSAEVEASREESANQRVETPPPMFINLNRFIQSLRQRSFPAFRPDIDPMSESEPNSLSLDSSREYYKEIDYTAASGQVSPCFTSL